MKRVFPGDNLILAIGWLTDVIPKLDAKKRYSVEVKEHHEKRSLNANNYCWQLMGQIAREQKTSDNEVYHIMLMRYGHTKLTDHGAMTISLDARVDLSIDTDEYLYIHSAPIGNGKVNGKEFTHYRLIRGSSEYDTKEMAQFIDGVVDEAQKMGIETKTPDELAAMVSRWEAA